ncbi:MAG: hypothetical protein Q4G24_12670 [Paracoccus sp. (in: a-proteobacteria)]|uniref:hypothetical protein n=1 Tax=Paracoccus sp. TaxID=267 RepID=UPI0026DF5AB6|nr:hypothetical protein [Paracoccus sp. (in: a-proteobacteria)]MDO5622312.1 hypothetical protein [Paracoccus sp. (in: a-proteobacteria)]
MTPDQPIFLGFRKDRIGARLVNLLNVQRLSQKFGVTGRMVWLSQPDGPYPELTDPERFFAPRFVRQHMIVMDQHPDMAGRKLFPALAGSTGDEAVARMLDQGQRFSVDTNLEICRMMGEDRAEVDDQIAALVAGLELAPGIRKPLEQARAQLAAKWGPGRPFAIHVRRGDILDGDPWSRTSWPAKYVPDEFFRAFVAEVDGPVIAFSDTPEAVLHMAQGDPRILPVGDLVDFSRLDTAERDLIELLLMAGCRLIGAPSLSAFSRAAEVIGGADVAPLPGGLPEAVRTAAYDALLERVISAPDSFYRPDSGVQGDLAQSVQFAAPQAVTRGRVSELLAVFQGERADMLNRHPFLNRALATAAVGGGLTEVARELAHAGIAAHGIRHRDRVECEQVMTLLTYDPGGADASAAEADFLNQLFQGRSQDSPILPHMGRRLMLSGGMAARALMLPPALVLDQSYTPPQVEGGAPLPPVLPVWMLLTDWEELLDSDSRRYALRNWPDLWNKIRNLGQDARDLVQQSVDKADIPVIGDDLAIRAGFLGAILRLHGRLMRAFAVLHQIDDQRPNDALTHKRLADACFRAGNVRAGTRWLDSARELAPDNPLLHLSAAARAVEFDQPVRLKWALRKAETLLPDAPLMARKRHQWGLPPDM